MVYDIYIYTIIFNNIMINNNIVIYVYLYIYIYIHIYIYNVYICICIYICARILGMIWDLMGVEFS